MSENGKETRKSMYIVALIAIIIFLCIHKCNPDKEIIIIPEEKGSFTDTIVKHNTITDTVFSTKYVTKYKESINVWKSENDSLKSQILKLLAENKKDSVFTLIDKELSLKTFNGNFENESVLIGYSGIVKGEVKAIDIDYTIKEKQIELKNKLEVFAGPKLGYELQSEKLNLGLGIDAKYGNMLYNASFNTDKQINIGISKKIF